MNGLGSAPLLRVENLQAYYGKSHVLHGVDLTVGEGEIVSLLGRNGVGRSTTAKAIMRLVDATGTVEFRSHDLMRLKTFEVAHRGIGYVPENREIFPTLTVEENLKLGVKRRPQVSLDLSRCLPPVSTAARACAHACRRAVRGRAADAHAGAYHDGRSGTGHHR